jgi:ParB-like chromosome segregation protein Spo0J
MGGEKSHHYIINDGHHRFEAAKRLNIEEIPIILLELT